MNRNAPCPCGSGKRFKHCCGVARASRARDDALAAHRAGSLGRAETLYRRALQEQPDDIDSLHMLGVVQLQRQRYREALDLVWDAAERTGWSVSEIRHNVGLVLGKLVTRDANIRQADLLADFVAREQALRTSSADVSPLVSVVLPAYNHARYVAQAIASVAAQTYPHIELIVIDDGSTDRTAAVISGCVAGAGFPVRFIARENRGAPATLNEGAALAKGRYLAFLNSDDYYAPDRIATLVDEIARVGVSWGFSLVSNAGVEAGPNAPAVAGVADILQRQRNFLGTQPNSFTLVEYNIAISTGNLFVERDFFSAVGGFRDYRYNHDWDFCLRASAFAEPIVVDRPLYFYRRHESNTIGESGDRATEDADRVLRDFLATVLSGTAPFTNDLGPHSPANRAVLLKLAFRAGQGALVPIPMLRSMAAQWRAAPAPRRAGEHESAPHLALRKTALVVLGMHRSGTSAMSRVLNLCGAFLPEKLKPPKIGVNPKGFWEPEAVLELNARVMRQMGGEWDRVDFPLQTTGDIAEEFDSDARALLASEYEGRATIVIKDPRMCVLAPLWHRALVSSGYRPVYVVPIRHPLEVARSLHARGDMTVDAGLTLWSAYMKRVLEFTDGRPDVLYVRFSELLDDWRGVVARIAARSDVPLDAGERATEVDRFLEHGLKRQSADEDALDAATADSSLAEIGPRYRSCLARCHRDASASRAVPVASHPGPAPPGPDDSSTVGFVLCIENNPIRHQALLLCESIRRFGGRYSGSPILAFAPRPGMGVDRATRCALEGMGVEYVDQPLNTTCLEYAPANRVFAGAWAEAHTATDFLVVLDSDTLWFDEPELPRDADAAVRPVDVKGSATRGPGDRFEDYWARLAQIGGTSLDRLPRLRSTIGNEHIRASYNAGLTVVRRRKGILTRCADLFSASLAAGMRPYRGSGMNIFASTGHVGQEGSEYWGSSQAAMTLAIWATTDRVIHYPDHYNVPLHLIAAHGEIDPRWLSRPPVHLHYHWMFAPRQHEVAMELLAKLGLSEDRQAWVRRRTPLADHEQESSHDAIAAQ